MNFLVLILFNEETIKTYVERAELVYKQTELKTNSGALKLFIDNLRLITIKSSRHETVC
jgi:hypothetical protein